VFGVSTGNKQTVNKFIFKTGGKRARVRWYKYTVLVDLLERKQTRASHAWCAALKVHQMQASTQMTSVPRPFASDSAK
jgi:hypothetical protein